MRRFVVLLIVGIAFIQPTYADGELRATYLMAGSAFRPYIESAPAVDANGTVYVAAILDATDSARLVALTRNGGTLALKWPAAVNINARVEASPLLGPNSTLYIGDMDGVFHAFDQATGASKWGAGYDTNPLLPSGDAGLGYIHGTASVAPDGSAIYVTVGVYPHAPKPGGLLCAFSPSGSLLWYLSFPDSIESSPAVASDGTIYFGGGGQDDNNVYAVNPVTHAIKWRRPLDAPIFGSAAIGPDGTIYIGSVGSEFVALTPAGDIKWSRGLSVTGSAAVGPDGKVYVGNNFDFLLYALDTQTGETKWTRDGWPSAGSTPLIRADNTIIFGGNVSDNSVSTYGVLRAYDPGDGHILWDSDKLIGNALLSSVVISPAADHTIYIGSMDGYLYAFGGNEYGVSRYASWPMFQHDPAHSGDGPEPVMGGQLVNLATRGVVGPATQLTTGFVVRGTGVKKLLVRGVGPTLKSFNVPTALPDPSLTIRVTNSGSANPDAFKFVNDNWEQSGDLADIVASTEAVGTFSLTPGSKDAATITLAAQLQPLNYTGTVESVDGQSGIALLEVYDVNPELVGTQLINLSARGHVGTGDNVLIPGLIVRGNGKTRLLIRAVGPGLTPPPFNVPGVLPNPSITVYDSKSRQLGTNTGWTTDGWKGEIIVAQKLAGAFPLADNSTDSAMIIALDPGAYTLPVSGVGGTSGEVLVEVYVLPF